MSGRSWVTWADRARSVIDLVIRENPDLTGHALRKALGDAYPFGERKYHPYKAWLKEVKRAVTERTTGRLPARSVVQVLPGQGRLL